jgi:hypothetical protein
MSLVGSLEDLGLGELLQIIGLSGKSGVLTLRSEEGEGCIVFRGGLICSARIKDGPTDLRELLASRQAVPDAELEALCEEARSRGLPLEPVVLERTAFDAESLNALRRENIERAVVAMFHWQGGQFSFEMRDADAKDDSGETGLSRGGIQPQFIALEGARLEDETRAAGGEPDPADPASDEERLPALESSAGPPASERSLQPDAEPQEAESTTPEAAPAPEAVPALASPIVILDPDLAVLEWAKAALRSSFPRVHIFQHAELAIARIRQYLLLRCPSRSRERRSELHGHRSTTPRSGSSHAGRGSRRPGFRRRAGWLVAPRGVPHRGKASSPPPGRSSRQDAA